MKFCCIIPDRGDRKELTDFCLKQLDRMTVKPDKIYHINHRPYVEGVDLVSRIKVGVNLAKEDGIDWCFVFENDDAYPENYFERYLPYLNDYDFIGDDKTIYYNIRTRRWSMFMHGKSNGYRSSLFTTAFRISALNNFEWPAETPFLDLKIWEYARHKRRKFIPSGAVGIKHNTGKCGGKGHLMKLHNADPEMTFLKSKLQDYHIEFYEQFNKVTA